MLKNLLKRNFSLKLEKLSSAQVYNDMSTSSLLNAYTIIYFSQYNFLIDNFETIIKYSQKFLGKRIFFSLLKHTIGKQFTTGQTMEETAPVVERLSNKGISLIAYYMAEHLGETVEESFYEDNYKEYMKSLELSKFSSLPDFSIAIKMTALIDHAFLVRANSLQQVFDDLFLKNESLEHDDQLGNYVRKDFLMNAFKNKFLELKNEDWEGFMDLLKLTNDKDKIYYFEYRLNLGFYNLYNKKMNSNKIFQKMCNYTESEIEHIKLSLTRIQNIISKADSLKSSVVMDAEQSWLQNAVYNITEQYQIINNNKNKTLMMNTIQAYCTDAELKAEKEINKKIFFKDSYPISFKLVRGAYMKEENELAKKNNVKSPIWEDKEHTDICYDKISNLVTNHLVKNSKFIVATHNNTSAYKIMEKMQDEKNEEKKNVYNDSIYFASLYGLNDLLTYQTLNNGYKSIKYLSYGENEITVPFLIRRGIECKEILQRSNHELDFIKEDVKRRMKFWKKK